MINNTYAKAIVSTCTTLKISADASNMSSAMLVETEFEEDIGVESMERDFCDGEGIEGTREVGVEPSEVSTDWTSRAASSCANRDHSCWAAAAGSRIDNLTTLNKDLVREK